MSVQAIAIRGPFTDDDVAELTAVLRRIDSRDPTATFEFYALDPDESLFDSKRLLAEVLPEMPEMPDRRTDIADDPLRQYGLGRNAGLSEAVKVLGVSADTIRLAAGEMTAQEMRSVRAVLRWMQATIRRRISAKS